MRTFTILAVIAALGAPFVSGWPTKSAAQKGGVDAKSDKWDWRSCGLPSDPVQVYSIEVSPDPPQPGKDLTVTAKGRVLQTIQEGAYADVVVKLGYIKLLQKQFDICEEARTNNATIQCPVEKDDYTVVQTVALPKEIPKAKFAINIKGYTADDDDMMCLDLTINFMTARLF